MLFAGIDDLCSGERHWSIGSLWGRDFRQARRGHGAEWALKPVFPLGSYETSRFNVTQVGSVRFVIVSGVVGQTKMTGSSATKLLNGDVCHRTVNGKNASKNGFVKNHCLFQQPRKYHRPGEKEKVRPDVKYRRWENEGGGINNQC